MIKKQMPKNNENNIIDPIVKKKKVYLAIDEDDAKVITKALGNNNYKVKSFQEPLEIQYYRMAEEIAENAIIEKIKHMTTEEQDEYFKYLSKEYLIEKLLKGEDIYNQ